MLAAEENGIAPEKGLIFRRRRTSTRVYDTIEVSGFSYLCFPEDISWFQGNIYTEDESNYSLYGEKLKNISEEKEIENEAEIEIEIEEEAKKEKDDEDNNDIDNTKKEKESQSQDQYFQVTLIDYFSGMKYRLPKIIIDTEVLLNSPSTPSESSLLSCRSSMYSDQISFKVQNTFRGQKAEILIQKHLGTSNLVGNKLIVCSGNIDISFTEISDGLVKSWCL